MKFKNYVAIVRNNAFQYVTGVNSCNAVWENGRPAKAMTQALANDVVTGLRSNGYPAVLVRVPDYEDPVNPEPEDYWGVTRWCDEDIANELVEQGYIPTQAAIKSIRNSVAKYIHDAAVEAGWAVISEEIREQGKNFPKSMSIYTDADEVAEAIGEVFGTYRVEKGKHIIDYDGEMHFYDSAEDLCLAWEATLRQQHNDNAGAPGADWTQELLFIDALKARMA